MIDPVKACMLVRFGSVELECAVLRQKGPRKSCGDEASRLEARRYIESFTPDPFDLEAWSFAARRRFERPKSEGTSSISRLRGSSWLSRAYGSTLSIQRSDVLDVRLSLKAAWETKPMIDRLPEPVARTLGLIQTDATIQSPERLLAIARQGARDPSKLTTTEIKDLCLALLIHYAQMGIG